MQTTNTNTLSKSQKRKKRNKKSQAVRAIASAQKQQPPSTTSTQPIAITSASVTATATSEQKSSTHEQKGGQKGNVVDHSASVTASNEQNASTREQKGEQKGKVVDHQLQKIAEMRERNEKKRSKYTDTAAHILVVALSQVLHLEIKEFETEYASDTKAKLKSKCELLDKPDTKTMESVAILVNEIIEGNHHVHVTSLSSSSKTQTVQIGEFEPNVCPSDTSDGSLFHTKTTRELGHVKLGKVKFKKSKNVIEIDYEVQQNATGAANAAHSKMSKKRSSLLQDNPQAFVRERIVNITLDAFKSSVDAAALGERLNEELPHILSAFQNEIYTRGMKAASSNPTPLFSLF